MIPYQSYGLLDFHVQCNILQDLALFCDFTMMETLYYFGILYGMSIKKVKERGKYLLELLELPSVNKAIKNLR